MFLFQLLFEVKVWNFTGRVLVIGERERERLASAQERGRPFTEMHFGSKTSGDVLDPTGVPQVWKGTLTLRGSNGDAEASPFAASTLLSHVQSFTFSTPLFFEKDM